MIKISPPCLMKFYVFSLHLQKIIKYICIHSTQSQRSIRWGCGLSLFRPYLKVLTGYSGGVQQLVVLF
ncbi:hypothetical protein FEF66_22560 [Salmonella enterica]|nr:hypothetical protein [Salmonella enterica]